MLRIICVATLLALAKCDSKEPKAFETGSLEGEWTTIKVYPETPVGGACEPFKIELTSEQCEHDKNKIPVINVIVPHHGSIKAPVVFMETEDDEVEEALSKKCKCEDKSINPKKFYVFRYVDENYFLVYTSYAGANMAMLMAKNVPTKEEFEEYEKHNAVLSDEEGYLMCTKEDMVTGTRRVSNKFSASKDTEPTHWLNYQTTTTTTEPSN